MRPSTLSLTALSHEAGEFLASRPEPPPSLRAQSKRVQGDGQGFKAKGSVLASRLAAVFQGRRFASLKPLNSRQRTKELD